MENVFPIVNFSILPKDLDDERILFRHLGANFGRIMLWVTDGQYFVSTELRVRASPPFARVANNSGLIVQRGFPGRLSAANLSVETNLDARGEAVRFAVLEPPARGRLLVDGAPAEEFSEADLRRGAVEYANNVSADSTGIKIQYT